MNRRGRRERNSQRSKSLKKLRLTHLLLSQLAEQIPDVNQSPNSQQSNLRQQHTKNLSKLKSLTQRLEKNQEQTNKKSKKRKSVPKKRKSVPKKRKSVLKMTQSLLYQQPEIPLTNQANPTPQLQPPTQPQLQTNLINRLLDSTITIRKLCITFLLIFLFFTYSSLSLEKRAFILKVLQYLCQTSFNGSPFQQYIKATKSQGSQSTLHQKISENPQFLKKYCQKQHCKYGIIQYKSFNSKTAQEIIQNDL